MKSKIKLFILISILSISLYSQPGGPGGGPEGGDPPVGDPVEVPLDGGAGILLLIGTVIALRKKIKK